MLTLSFSLMAGKAFAQDNYSVLAYHSVVDESVPKSQQLFISQTIPVQKLISHFNWLKDNGYNVISWQQVIDAEKAKAHYRQKRLCSLLMMAMKRCIA